MCLPCVFLYDVVYKQCIQYTTIHSMQYYAQSSREMFSPWRDSSPLLPNSLYILLSTLFISLIFSSKWVDSAEQWHWCFWYEEQYLLWRILTSNPFSESDIILTRWIVRTVSFLCLSALCDVTYLNDLFIHHSFGTLISVSLASTKNPDIILNYSSLLKGISVFPTKNDLRQYKGNTNFLCISWKIKLNSPVERYPNNIPMKSQLS